MLPKELRIRKSSDFQQIYKKAGKYYSRYFILRYFVNSTNTNPRFALVVTKKVGKANVRNRLRRIYREIIKLEAPKLKSTYDLIFIISANSIDADAATITTEIEKAFRSLHLYK